ncbi:MAG TPA: LuxR C-terminal-related transcriptional regulator [bacterium]|nr:LuxR C-terminal-related transcriptional regulator [bacterium]
MEYAGRLVGFDHAAFASYTDDFFSAPPHYIKVYLSNPGYRKELKRAFQVSRRQYGAYVDTEVFSFSERNRSPFFNEILRDNGIRGQVVAVIHFGGVVSGVIHLNREGGVFKPSDLDKLMPLFRVVGAAHAAIEPSVSSLGCGLGKFSLTPREREIAGFIAQGKINLDIAAILGLSVHTVRRQVESVLAKCGVSSRAMVATLVGQGLSTLRQPPKLAPGIPSEILEQAWGDMQSSIPRLV